MDKNDKIPEPYPIVPQEKNSSSEEKTIPGYREDTLAIRSGFHRTDYGEHSEPLFLTVSFVHKNAQNAADKFAEHTGGYIYSRFTNPTVQLFEKRLADLEGAEEARATSSGMAAIQAVLMALTRTGSHIVCSSSVFGTTVQLFKLFERYNITTTYVPLSDLDAWTHAIRPETAFLFLETPSNPLTEIADLSSLSALARKKEVPLVVDNCLCTPVLQKPFSYGADIVIHSATKYLDGQGRVLGGAIVGSEKYIAKMKPVLRYGGPTLSAFNAWVLAKGLETLPIRMRQHTHNALIVAQWIQEQGCISKVWYPGLSSHPQYALAKKQQLGGGPIVSFLVSGDSDLSRKKRAWEIIDNCKLISITANLGDTKSTITHPATTTHAKMSEEMRSSTGIDQGLIRLAVGLEDPTDICSDLYNGIELIL